ncbi:hypothetical protein Hanom_Chr15g01379151 [Helianthus anomalus]
MRSKGRSRAESQKMARKPAKVDEKPKEQKVQEQKVKISQGQKDRLRKKRKKAREYLERIIFSDTTGKSDKSSDKPSCSPKNDKSSKTSSSDTNLRTNEILKEKKVVGDESDSLKSDKPPSGDDSGSSKPEEPLVDVKSGDSGLTMNDENFPSLSKGILKTPKDRQAWVKLFKK